MRSVSVAVLFAAALLISHSASAERRMFIVSSNSEGYGIDQCLSKGEKCGAAMATAYCKSRDFAQADTFRKVDRDDITGAIPATAPATCRGASCDEFVAIVCTR